MTTKQIFFSIFMLGTLSSNLISMDENALSMKEISKITHFLITGRGKLAENEALTREERIRDEQAERFLRELYKFKMDTWGYER